MKFSKVCIGSLIALLFFICISNSVSFAQPLSERLAQDREEYLAKQILPQDLEYINKELPRALMAIAKLNETLSTIWSALPDCDKIAKQEFRNFNDAKNKTLKDIYKFEPSPDAFAVTITNGLDVENTRGLTSEIIKLIWAINNLPDIKTQDEEDAKALNQCQEFMKKTNKFNKETNSDVVQILNAAAKDCNSIKETLLKASKINELKKFIAAQNTYYNNAINSTDFYLCTQNYKQGESWYLDLTNEIAQLTLRQFELNNNFFKALEMRLANIAIPQEPKMPDLSILSVRIWPPRGIHGEDKQLKDIRIADKIKIVAVIKNNGEFSADASLSCLTREEGDLAINAEIPPIDPGATYEAIWEYTLTQLKNTFSITANCDHEAWESDDAFDDNEVKIYLNLEDTADLDIKIVDIPEKTYINEAINIKAHIKNNGNRFVVDPSVAFRVNGKLIEENKLSSTIEANGEAETVFSWKPTESGQYTVTCEVDPNDEKKEFDKANNIASENVDVISPEGAKDNSPEVGGNGKE